VLLGCGKFGQLRVRVGLSLRKLLGGIVQEHLRLEQLTMLLMKLDVLINEHFEKLLDAVQAILFTPFCFVTYGGFSRSSLLLQRMKTVNLALDFLVFQRSHA
jgi:hypothetical protein